MPHTPGPWAVCDVPPNTQWYAGTTIYSAARDTRVADACNLTYDAPANARLIAASPTMLAALRDCVAALGGIHSDNVPETARIAIELATGEKE